MHIVCLIVTGLRIWAKKSSVLEIKITEKVKLLNLTEIEITDRANGSDLSNTSLCQGAFALRHSNTAKKEN